jgi:DMSO/TMAO reductase YedYZ heme-binding membrane subunit
MSNSDKEKITGKFSLMEYHRKVMDARRSIGFKAFLSLVALHLVVIKGYAELNENISCLWKEIAFKCIVIAGLSALCLLFLGFMVQIEIANRKDRKRYLSLEDELWHSLQGDEKPYKYEETL